MEDATVKELYEILSKYVDKYPNAKICLPDTKKGKTRFLANKILWSCDEYLCMPYNKYKEKGE